MDIVHLAAAAVDALFLVILTLVTATIAMGVVRDRDPYGPVLDQRSHVRIVPAPYDWQHENDMGAHR